MDEWKSYSVERPTEKGVYEWKVPSTRIHGMFVTFQSWFRMRSTANSEVLAPSFSGWNGWNLTLPSDVSWRIPEIPNINLQKHEYGNLGIDGLIFHKCPYCLEVPELRGWWFGDGGGVIVAAEPFNYNAWQLKCCSWGETPELKDPHKIEETRRAAFARMCLPKDVQND